MIEQEKKNKDLAKKIFVEKLSSSKKIFLCEKIVCNFQYKSYSNFFDFLIIFLMSLMMEVRRYKRYRLPYLELTEDSPVTTGTTEQKFLVIFWIAIIWGKKIETDDDIEEVEKGSVLRNYLMDTQSDYEQMLDDTIRNFVSK